MSSGSFVCPRTRSLTLPSTQRRTPLRPCVASARISQPPKMLYPLSTLPCSATFIRASATSVLPATDQVMESLLLQDWVHALTATPLIITPWQLHYLCEVQ